MTVALMRRTGPGAATPRHCMGAHMLHCLVGARRSDAPPARGRPSQGVAVARALGLAGRGEVSHGGGVREWEGLRSSGSSKRAPRAPPTTVGGAFDSPALSGTLAP